MSAESMFNDYLSGLTAITDLVPAAHILTGDVQNDQFDVPYITLNVPRKRGPEGNTVFTQDCELIIDIFTGTRSDGLDIADALLMALHNTAMTSGQDHIEFIRLESQSDMQEPDGMHHFNQQYEFRFQS